MPLTIRIKRIYDEASDGDGHRILVDRIWPRGLSKEKAEVHRWLKEVAPSTELRKWFGHDPKKWAEFKKRYFKELKEQTASIDYLLDCARNKTLTLVYSARDQEHNQAAALKEYLSRRL